MRLFQGLLGLLFPARATERLLRTTLYDELAARINPVALTDTVALLPYRDPLVHACIVEAKFYGSEKAWESLGTALAEYLVERLGEDAPLGGSAILVPVPLSRIRLRERGYNQVEEVCKRALKRLKGVATLNSPALSRVRDTPPQTTLDGEARRENMQDAFMAAERLDPTLLYIVVDDVTTTGATISAAVSALRDRGCTNVLAVALAH